MNYTTKEIIDSIRKEDNKSVLSYLYKHYSQRIRKLILDNGGSQEDAEDILQESIVIFYKHVKLHKFDVNHEVGAFLYTVARNLWVNETKKKKVKEKYIESVDKGNYQNCFLDDLLTEEKNNIMENVFLQLGERCRELLTYSMYDKLSMKEICKKMGFQTENGAKTRNYKCKQHLITLLKNNPIINELMKDEPLQREL